MRWIVLLNLLFPLLSPLFASSDGPLSSGAPFRRVSDIFKQASLAVRERRPAELAGVVTCAEPHWGATPQVFIHDGSGGILVSYTGGERFTVGDLLEVSGTVEDGSYTPVISASQCRKIGEKPLPDPKPVSSAELFTGALDGERVSIEGWIRNVGHVTPTLASMDIQTDGARLAVRISSADQDSFDSLVGAKVRITGVARGLLLRTNTRTLTEVRVFVAGPSDVALIAPPPPLPELNPGAPLSDAFEFHPGETPGTRARVAGTVAFCAGDKVYLSKDGGGLIVHCPEPASLTPGQYVEAIGFPEIVQKLPVLQDAIIRPLPGAARA